MPNKTTLLITAPPPGLIVDLARRRPDWCVMEIGDAPPPEAIDGRVWGFIDWLCPSLSGLELCRRLREAEPTRRAHLTMVLESGDVEARRRALQAGADDYLVGPLNADAVLGRVGVLQSSDPATDNRRLVYRHGTLAVDCTAHQVRHDGGVIALRPNEFRLLVHFLEHPDQVFSRAALIDHLGKHALDIDERTVDVWIGRLRRSLVAAGAADPLRTVRSLGYVLDSLD
jgi:two-component system, OmpR family, phosphate regulon response regulator PhoB